MLLRRAEDDLQACRVLAEAAEVADGTVGFHAQQAVEKALKAAIVLTEVELPRTHDIELLKEQLEVAGRQLPNELAGVDWLTPWAVALRYDEPTALDRAAALAAAESACGWARTLSEP